MKTLLLKFTLKKLFYPILFQKLQSSLAIFFIRLPPEKKLPTGRKKQISAKKKIDKDPILLVVFLIMVLLQKSGEFGYT